MEAFSIVHTIGNDYYTKVTLRNTRITSVNAVEIGVEYPTITDAVNAINLI